MKRFFVPLIVLCLLVFLFSPWNSELPCANSISCVQNLTSIVENNATGNFLSQVISVPQIDEQTDTQTKILGTDSDSAVKRIYVDLAAQKLYAFEGDHLYLQTLVSAGKWGRTPTGEFKIWVKIRSTRMAGGSGNDAYDLPNVPYVMFFYSNSVGKERGFGFHGAYWHNNFGHAMSHGCINMREVDAKMLYDWASPTSISSTTYASQEDPGTAVSICSRIEVKEGKQPLCLE